MSKKEAEAVAWAVEGLVGQALNGGVAIDVIQSVVNGLLMSSPKVFAAIEQLSSDEVVEFCRSELNIPGEQS